MSTMAGPQDVELLYLASRINAAGKKAAEQLSDEDKGAIATFYTNKLNVVAQFSNPKTATLFVVPTNTFPSAIVGVMNLLPGPK